MIEQLAKMMPQINEFFYTLSGLVAISAGIRGLRNKKAPIGTFVFWTVLGLMFIFGNTIIVAYKDTGAAVIGAGLFVLAGLTLTKQVQAGDFQIQPLSEREDAAKKLKNMIFWPAIALAVVAMTLAQIKLPYTAMVDGASKAMTFTFSGAAAIGIASLDMIFWPAIALAVVAMTLAQIKLPYTAMVDGASKAMTFTFSGAAAIGIASLVALLIGVLITKPSGKKIVDDSNRLVMLVGSAALLPQLLGALGSLFTSAGVGTVVSGMISSVIPSNSILIGVIIYVLGMVIFTMIMGNSFAAFSVITLGIGIPFVIAQGGNPAVVGALGMTAGFCGTLLTPMAANFNIVPGAVLETRNKYTIIKAQAPVALILIVVHIVLMLVLAF